MLNQPSLHELPRGASPGRTAGNSGTEAGSGTGPAGDNVDREKSTVSSSKLS